MRPLYISVYDCSAAVDVLSTHTQLDGVIFRHSLLSSREELNDIIHTLIPRAEHVKVRLYMKDNRLLHNEHLTHVRETLLQLKGHNIGLFIGDPAVISIAKSIEYDGEIIFAPEMIMTSLGSAQFWMNQGANNVEISHELTFKELNFMIENLTKLPFVQIHGQLSMFQSRRLLVDNYFTHLNHEEAIESHGQLSLYDKERDLRYIVTQDERGTEIYNGHIISIIDLLDRFPIMPNCIVDTYFLTRQKRNEVIELYIEVTQDTAYTINKEMYAKKIQMIYADTPVSRGFFLKPTIF